MNKTSRIFVGALFLCLLSANVSAKYCVKLPSCEELGYIFPYKEGRRSIRCPFDTTKVLYLDYCQAYGLSSKPNDAAGAYQECVEEKADGTKINTGYYRYTRCNSGYTYQSGDCVSSRKKYNIGDIYYYNNTAIGVVYYDDGKTTKVVALKNVTGSGGQASVASISLPWSTAYSNSDIYSYDVSGLTNFDNASSAVKDMDGKSNTQKILSYIKSKGYTAQAATATNKYAPSVCPNGSICGAGEWYLPALGELQTIYDNREIIDPSLRSLDGHGIEGTQDFWSSTQSSGGAWGLDVSRQHVSSYVKEFYAMVRPVLAF